MDKKINIDIYGVPEKVLGHSGGCGGCSKRSSNSEIGMGCHGCDKAGDNKCSNCGISKSSSMGCKNTVSKTTSQYYMELIQFLRTSDIKDFISARFIDLNKINILDYDDIRVLDEFGYEAPYVVIDGIIRYYGGISNKLIYKDVKELMEG